jgi:electron transfer flavoprotein alpha subunit
VSSNGVVIVTWGQNGEAFAGEADDVLTLGRNSAEALGGELRWLTLGAVSDEIQQVAGRHGVAGIDRIEDAKLAEPSSDAIVAALAQYCSRKAPRLVLFAQGFDVRLIAPRLAARMGAGVVMNGAAIEIADGGKLAVTASAYGGDTRRVYEVAAGRACVVSVLANAVPPADAAAPTTPDVSEVAVDLGSVEERIRVIQAAKTEGPRLDDAEVIVSGGRGLGAPENYKLIIELAEALGGLPGASRPLVDEGWVDSSHQVGLTGIITRPGLYLAAGISGASQHMAGCSAAKTIVAINTDADASVFRYARYGIVADCLEVLPELIRAAKS